MSLLVLLLVVLIVAALAMWAVYYIPFPPGSPTFIKPLLYVVILVIAIIVILARSGVVNAQDRAPVPILKKNTTLISIEIPSDKPKARWNEKSYVGATSCIQEGSRVTCNNGYQTTVK